MGHRTGGLQDDRDVHRDLDRVVFPHRHASHDLCLRLHHSFKPQWLKGRTMDDKALPRQRAQGHTHRTEDRRGEQGGTRVGRKNGSPRRAESVTGCTRKTSRGSPLRRQTTDAPVAEVAVLGPGLCDWDKASSLWSFRSRGAWVTADVGVMQGWCRDREKRWEKTSVRLSNRPMSGPFVSIYGLGGRETKRLTSFQVIVGLLSVKVLRLSFVSPVGVGETVRGRRLTGQLPWSTTEPREGPVY